MGAKTWNLESMGAMQRKLDALNWLVEVSVVMNSTVQLQPLLVFIMQTATEITRAEAASVLLMDPRTQELRFTASTGSDSGQLIGMVVPTEGSIAGKIISEGRAIIIDDVKQEPGHFRQVDQKIAFQTRSILGVPMRIKDRLVGVIEVVNKKEGKFDDEDLRHINILAAQAAVALENAQLILELREANEELSNLDKLKNDFIAIASHELRTPLSIILGYATFLQEEAEGEAGSHAEMVFQSAMHLRNIIEDMTNLRFVQADVAEFVVVDTPIMGVLREAYNDVKSIAETKEQSLVLNDSASPLMAKADGLKLQLAVTNVLNNAVKFTPEKGQITVSAEERPHEIWIRVADNGIGIPEDELERIFDQFHQVEDHLTRKAGGMGLGLSIARAIINAQGGRIWAESKGMGQGSTFTIAVPTASQTATPAS